MEVGGIGLHASLQAIIDLVELLNFSQSPLQGPISLLRRQQELTVELTYN